MRQNEWINVQKPDTGIALILAVSLVLYFSAFPVIHFVGYEY